MDKKNDWQKILVDVNTTILTAMTLMDKTSLRALLVVNRSEQLLGIITDGDIRRYLLRQATLHDTVDKVMNKTPVTASIAENRNQLLLKMQSLGIFHLPIIDNDRRVVGLETFDGLFKKDTLDNWVVFMAGGLGKRLHPLTIDCPKPLIKISGKPISEILLESFIESGFRNYYFSVNYKADMIREHFGSGHRWSVNIEYIEEKVALGTAGSLSLLPSTPDQAFFVANTDILTTMNFSHLLDFHKQHQAHATLCVREYENIIPYGVVRINQTDYRLLGIDEKPKRTFFVCAGIYILEPDVLQYLPNGYHQDMPYFLTELAQQGFNISSFPIHEYWIDIGRHDDLEKATKDYLEVF